MNKTSIIIMAFALVIVSSLCGYAWSSHDLEHLRNKQYLDEIQMLEEENIHLRQQLNELRMEQNPRLHSEIKRLNESYGQFIDINK